MSRRSRSCGVFLLAGCAALAAARPAPAQTYLPTSSLHPVVLLDTYLDYSMLLLTPPRGFGLLSSARAPGESRMGAYRDFERSLVERTTGVVGPGSREGARRAREGLLATLSARLDGLPGGSFFRQSRALWQRIEGSTDFELEGFRVRLRVDEVAEGKLALKLQKELR